MVHMFIKVKFAGNPQRCWIVTPTTLSVCTYNDGERHIKRGGGAGVNHVKRDWLEIFNVNCL